MHALLRARPSLVLVAVLSACVAPGWHAPQNVARAAEAQRASEFEFHRDHVIGTSLDVCVVAPDEVTAEGVELTVLNEIERLRKIFSTYDATTEISKLNRSREPVPVSREMVEVLKAYEAWQLRSGGAFHGQVGELVRVWKEAEKVGKLPEAIVLDRISADLKKPGWKLDEGAGTLTRLTDQPLNLNSIGKGFIIQKAADAVRKAHPNVTALLINLGGDILAWGVPPGGSGWAVGVQNPFSSFDNAAPVAGLRLTNQAIATSGDYQRFHTIGGQRYSHIFDPRTG
ncbi:MAG TPA: FAD:protein FMN transferase, partial [Gemmata sp.]